MRMNLENCLRNTLRHDQWLAAELTGNLRELRDRARDGGAMAALHEFFNLYRFDDNELAADGLWTDPRPQSPPPAKTEAEVEKLRRIYYQNIVYHACSVLDQIEHRDFTKGEGIVCGTADEPNDEVVLAFDRLLSRIREWARWDDCAYVWHEDAQIATGGGFASFGSWQYRYKNCQGGGRTIEEAVKSASALCPRIMVGSKQPAGETARGGCPVSGG